MEKILTLIKCSVSFRLPLVILHYLFFVPCSISNPVALLLLFLHPAFITMIAWWCNANKRGWSETADTHLKKGHIRCHFLALIQGDPSHEHHGPSGPIGLGQSWWGKGGCPPPPPPRLLVWLLTSDEGVLVKGGGMTPAFLPSSERLLRQSHFQRQPCRGVHRKWIQVCHHHPLVQAGGEGLKHLTLFLCVIVPKRHRLLLRLPQGPTSSGSSYREPLVTLAVRNR